MPLRVHSVILSRLRRFSLISSLGSMLLGLMSKAYPKKLVFSIVASDGNRVFLDS